MHTSLPLTSRVSKTLSFALGTKKWKAKYNNVFASDDDDFSHKYPPHIRIGPHSVKPEIYAVMNTLENQNHLSNRSTKRAILIAINCLVQRLWESENHMKNIRYGD